MSCELGLAIGESFAEIVGFSGSSPEPVIKSRWYLPRKNLTEGLKEALRALPDGSPVRLRVATDSVERILEKRQGRSPAVLTTSGFESWLKLRERRELPTEDDFIFGVSCRMGADGSETRAVDSEELGFLSAKFEMLKIKDLAVTLFHSSVNPNHERALAEFFRAKGLRVVESHLLPGESEADRFTAALQCAFAESAILEEKEQIESAVKSVSGLQCTLEIWTPQGPTSWDKYSARYVRGGLKAALTNSFAGREALHCGLDVISPYTPISPALSWPLKPTFLIKHGAWSFPHISDEHAGYAPGPMAFGKSQQLAALDVLYVRDRLSEIAGFTPLLNEKSRARILETIFTLGKSASHTASKRPPDAKEIAADLERAFVERLAILIAADFQPQSAQQQAKGAITLTGALAPSLVALLKSRRRDLRFELAPLAEYFESAAVAAASAKLDPAEAHA